jgi:hypothetical protein
MSCYVTTDANGNPVHNYVGDVSVDLTSASDGGAGYLAPGCNDPPPGNSLVVNEQLPAYTIRTSVSGSPVSALEPGALALLAIGLVALGMNRAVKRWLPGPPG